MKNKTVLIADIISSRNIKERYKVQKDILLVINLLNKSYKNHLIKNVEISSGDSFQGLFDHPSFAFLYIRMFQMLLYPIKVRSGIGVGSLDYLDNEFSSNLLDGEAYHNAKQALDAIDNSTKAITAFVSSKEKQQLTMPINTTFDMYYKLKSIFGIKALYISLVNELLNPMSLEGDINYLKSANEKEMEYILELIRKNSIQETQSLIQTNLMAIQSKPFAIFEKRNNKLIANKLEYVQRGIQEDIARIMGTTRQNIQRYFSKSIANERMYTASLMIFMDEVVE